MAIRSPSPMAPSYFPLRFYLAQSSTLGLLVIYDLADPLPHLRSRVSYPRDLIHLDSMAYHPPETLTGPGRTQNNVAIAFLILTWFFIALRVWTRTYVINNFGWDDTTMLLAGAIFTVYCATMLVLTAHGGAAHITDYAHMARLIKWTIIGEATYLATIMVLKISLGIFFGRIVVVPWHLRIIYITVIVNVLSNASAFVYVLLRCGPDIDQYLFMQLQYKCTPRNLDNFFAYQQAALTTFTDLVFATLPVFILWNTNMDLRSKLSVGFILSLAGLGIICSILRFRYIDGLTDVTDFFWNATNIAIWSTIEPGAGIIAGCLACLRPFVKSVFVKARSIRSSIDASKKDTSEASKSGHTHPGPRAAMMEEFCQPEKRARSNNHPQYDENTQARGRLHGEGDSAECILESMEPAYIFPSRSHESLDLDNESSAKRDSQSSLSPTDRTRVGSYDRSVLSTSAGTGKGTSWYV